MKTKLLAAPALLLVSSCALFAPNERRGVETLMETSRVKVEARFEVVDKQRMLRGFTAKRVPYATKFLSSFEATLFIDRDGNGLPSELEKRAVWSVTAVDGSPHIELNGSFKRPKDDLLAGPALIEIRIGYIDAERTTSEETAVSRVDI